MLGFRQLLPFSSTSGTVNRIRPVYTCQLFLERLAVAPTICISDWNMESSLPINPFVKRRKKKKKIRNFSRFVGIYLAFIPPAKLTLCMWRNQNLTRAFLDPSRTNTEPAECCKSDTRGARQLCEKACVLPACIMSGFKSRQCASLYWAVKKKERKKKALEKKKTSVAVSLSFSSRAFKLPSTQHRTAWSLDCN